MANAVKVDTLDPEQNSVNESIWIDQNLYSRLVAAERRRHQDRAGPRHQLGRLEGPADLHLPPAGREVLRRHPGHRAGRRLVHRTGAQAGRRLGLPDHRGQVDHRAGREDRRREAVRSRTPRCWRTWRCTPTPCCRRRRSSSRATSSSPTRSAAARSWSPPTTRTPRSTSSPTSTGTAPSRRSRTSSCRSSPTTTPGCSTCEAGKVDVIENPPSNLIEPDQLQSEAAGRPVPVDPRRLRPDVDEGPVLQEREGPPGGPRRGRPRRDEQAGLPGPRDAGDVVHAVQDGVLERQPAQAGGRHRQGEAAALAGRLPERVHHQHHHGQR